MGIEVEYLDHMGDDLTVVNAAKVSNAARSDVMTHREQRLIGYLARGCTLGNWSKIIDSVSGAANDAELSDILSHVKRMPTHWSPFAHCQISCRVKVPISTARQLFKHVVGITPNEVSRRYVKDVPELFGNELRLAASNVKQGSSDHLYDGEPVVVALSLSGEPFEISRPQLRQATVDMYDHMVNELGIAPECARFDLPQAMMTEFWWTGSLFAWANVYIQRSDSHAQREAQGVARLIDKIIAPKFPISWQALTQ